MRGRRLVAAVALLVAGCGGGTPTGSDAPSSSVPSASPGGTDESPTTDPSTSATPAATGPLVTRTGFELRVPEGYEVDDTYDLSITAFDDSGRNAIAIGNHEGVDRESLAALASESVRLGLWKGTPRRLEPITLAGERWYHLRGPQLAAPHAEEFGAWHAGTQVRLTFSSWSGAPRQQMIASVLATFTWH